MIPWRDVFSLDRDTPIIDALSEVSNHAYSRIPLWDPQRQLVTGVLYAKDLLTHRWSTPADSEVLQEAVYEISHRAVFTTGQASLTHLLDVFKRSRKHLAVVIAHPTGEVLGICTLEDVLEVLFGERGDAVGDLREEGGSSSPHPKEAASQRGEGFRPARLRIEIWKQKALLLFQKPSSSFHVL